MSEQKKILFVDQDSSVGKVLQLKINSLGYDARYAENLSDAFVILKSFTPDMIISEMDFDNGTGIDFLKYLRLNPDTSKIPVFFISKARNVENKIIALEMGAENIYAKPITINFVENLIQEYFNRALSKEDSDETVEELSGKLINVSLYDLFAIVEKNGKSGILNINASGDEKAYIYFLNGSVVRAESFQNPDPDNGLSLIYDISGWSDGLFTILYDETLKPVKNIFVSQKSLMMNLGEYLQENALRSRELPDPDKTVYINFKRFFENLSKFPDSIAGIIGHFRAEGILLDEIFRKESGFSRKKSEYVKKLIDMGVIVFQPSDEKYEIPENPSWFTDSSDKVLEDTSFTETEVVPKIVEDIFADEPEDELEELEELEEIDFEETESDTETNTETDETDEQSELPESSEENSFEEDAAFKSDVEDLINAEETFSESVEPETVTELKQKDEPVPDIDIISEPEAESDFVFDPDTIAPAENSSFDEHSIDMPETVFEEKSELSDIDFSEEKHSDIDEIFDSRDIADTKKVDSIDFLSEESDEDDALFAETGAEIEFLETKTETEGDSFDSAPAEEPLPTFNYKDVVDENIIDKVVESGQKSVYSIMIPAMIVSISCLLIAVFYILNRFILKTGDNVNAIKFERLLTPEEKANKEIAVLYGTNPKLVKNEDRIDVKNMSITQIAALAKDSFEKKDYEKAASYYRIAVMNATISTPEERAYEGQLWKNMAISLYYMNAYDNALSAVEKSLLISKAPIKIELKVAILKDLDRVDDAIETLENAIKDPDFSEEYIKKWKEELEKLKK